MTTASPPKIQRRASRLSTRLFLLFAVLLILPTLTLTTVPAVLEANRERGEILAELSNLADIQVREIERWVNTTSTELRDILNDPIVRPAANALTLGTGSQGDSQTFAERTDAILSAVGVYDRFILTTPDGVVLASSHPEIVPPGADMGGETWLAAALAASGDVVISGPMHDPVDGQESLYFSIAVRSSAMETPDGVFSGRIPIDRLQRVIFALPVTDETGDYYLVREGQRYVTAPLGSPGAEVAADEIIPTALGGQNGDGVWRNYRGVQVIGVYRWIEPLGMSLIVTQDLSAVLTARQTLIQTEILIGLIMIAGGIGLALLLSRRLTAPLEALSQVASRAARGDLAASAPLSQTLEFNQLGDSFNRMIAQIKGLLEQQEETIQSRTRQLELTSQIGRVIAAETDLDRLLKVTINMIRDQLGYYHAQIFLLDDLHQYAVLRASTGAVGQELLARGHKLASGSESVIGKVTTQSDPVLVRDTDTATVYRKNELLPDTKAELAVPLHVGDEVIGALDVQSTQRDAFDEATIAAFRTIADQLAVAIRNAQLFQEKEGLLSASLQLTQTLTRDTWDAYLADRDKPGGVTGFEYDLSEVRPVGEGGENGGDGHGLNLPIALRGEIIGQLEAHLPEGQRWTDEDRQFIGQVLDRVALALENARLFEQTQRSLAETNRLYHASQQIASAESVVDLVNEVIALCNASALDRAAVFLISDPDADATDRWADMAGAWTRIPDDPTTNQPRRQHTSQPPLKYIEEVPSDGLIVNDVDHSRMHSDAKATHQQMGVKSMAIFPFVAGRRTVGWLVLHSTRQVGAFTDELVRFYRTVTDQAATALEGLRLLEQAQTRVRRLQATNEVSRAASSILNPDILLPLTVDQISQAFNYYHAQIFLVDEGGATAVLRASTGEVGQELLRRGHRLDVGSQSVIGQVTSRGEPVIARDTDTDAVHKRNELLPNTRAEMAIPLKTGDRVIGALDVQSTEPNAFDAEAQVILQSLADQISVTLENAQLFQEIQDRVAELTTVNLVSQAVSRAETLEDLYEVVATQLQRTFGAQHAILAVISPGDMIEVPIFLEGGELLPPIAPIPMGQGLTSHVIRTREVLLINENMEEQSRQLGARVIGVLPRSLLAVPLLLGDEIVGVISIQDAEKEHAYNETHVRQLTTLAAYIAIKIRNAELLQEAQQRADELGFLFNVTRAAVASADLDEALTEVTRILQSEIAGTEAAIIYLSDPSGQKLEPHAAVGYARDLSVRLPAIPAGDGLIGEIVAHSKPLIVHTGQDDPRMADFDERTNSAVLVPLRAGPQSIGAVMIASTRAGFFGEGEQRLLEAASGTLTAIIQNARLLEQITEANNQLRELDRLKSQFLANMSHELRTPLNSIIGFSRVMLKGIDGPLSDLQSQDLTTIYNSGNHLLGLINDILDLSKIEAGKMEIQPEYIGLVEIIDGVMASGKGLVKDRPIQIFKEVEADLPQVYADPVRIRQVLLNLVSNASKFTKEGSITIRAHHQERDAETGESARVQVDVVDTGIGISEEDMGKLFEAFSQVDGTTTRQAGGTGLGLAITKQFVEMHVGRIWVTSEVGKGSVFSFTIPLHPQPVEGAEPVLLSENGEGKPVVLAVDDEPGVLDLYSRYLGKGGYAVVGLGNAADLLHHIRELQPVALLMDLNMPGKNGWEAIQEVRQAVEGQKLPIIICSIEDERTRAANLGVSQYLIKPVVEEDLLRALEQAIAMPPARPRDILVVDGDAEYVESMRKALASTPGYNVRVAPLGYEATQAIHDQRPDLLILDVDLPDMDGYGLLVAIRSREETRSIPTLVLTRRRVARDDLARLDEDLTQMLKKDKADPDAVLAKVTEILEKVPGPA